MKKPANPKTSQPPEAADPSRAEALDPSEITVVIPDSPASDFDPLPSDFAPTRPMPGDDPSTPPPEFRPPEEMSTLAIPLQRITTVDFSPDPLPQAHPEPAQGAQGTVVMPTSPVPAGPTKPAGSAWKLWLGAAGLAVVLAAGAGAWYLWPARVDRAGEPSGSAVRPAPAETVPPELRPYMDQARAGDAKAMHMIALMYWNGLNVRQDRAKGLEWYRKAATAGSTAAQETLRTIEGK